MLVEGVDTDIFQFFLGEMAHAISTKEGVRQTIDRGQRVVAPASIYSIQK